ncbi:ribonuclease H-like domain-containing protein [Tanacetum coccineum]
MTTVGTRVVVNKGKVENVLKKAKWVWRLKMNYQDHVYKYNGSYIFRRLRCPCYKIRLQLWIVMNLLDEMSSCSYETPRKDDVYNLDLKNIVLSGGLEKQLNHNVKIIRCDNGTEFKNYAMNEFCAKKGIKREFSVARTPQ